MKKNYFIILFLFATKLILSQNITVSGYISDKTTSEKLLGAYIYLDDNNVVLTNEFGFYSISVPASQNITLKYSYIGYKSSSITLKSSKNVSKNIFLVQDNEIGQVTITATKQNSLDYYSFKSKDIKTLPSLTSEKDAIKSLQLLPGVQSGNEGTSDLYVRGGTPDQNLILIDDIPLHFINHLGGFVSIFDINAINDMKLYKSGIPAKYGGHLSSVLDIRLKDGNMNKFGGEISMGFIAAKISLNGPIIKDKLSFLFTARKSNFDALSTLFYLTQDAADPIFMFYSFYDLNTKINYKISDKDKIDFTLYSGIDINKMYIKDTTRLTPTSEILEYVSNFQNTWGNYLFSTRWTHRYNNKLFQKMTVGYTHYHYDRNQSYTEKKQDTVIAFANQQYHTRIQDFIFKTDYDYFINNNDKLNFGLQSTFHIYNPGDFKSKVYLDEADTIYGAKNEAVLKTTDLSLYIDDTWKIKKLSINAGIYANLYYISDKFYPNIQPRIKFTFNASKNTVFNISYDHTVQNIHILTMSNSVVPADVWVPATHTAPPEIGNQYSLGFSQSFFDQKFTLSTSIFYKEASNLIDYQRYFYADDTVKTPTWEQQIATNGSGIIYGLEFLLEKNKGKFNSWVSYTYMKNTRTFEELNDGKPFPFAFDRRHNLQVVLIFNFNKNINLSSTFMYGSGYPTNLRITEINYVDILEGQSTNEFQGSYYVDANTTYSAVNDFDNSTLIYGDLNSYRMPAYHSLNIAFNWSKEKKRGTRTWSLNIYNAYNQQNAYFLFLQKTRHKLELYKYTMFPIIPSISYSFKF